MRLVGALVLLFLACSQAAACRVPFIRTFDNQTVSGTMTARSGKPCSIRLARTSGAMLSVQIVARPTQGSVIVGSGNRVIYQSRPGYTGPDAFTYARSGLNRQNDKVVRTVRVAVRVRS
jgi:hypothetical protein